MALRPHVAPELLQKVTKALGITALEQWYYVSHHAATKAIGASSLHAFGGTVASFLKYAYPNHHFDEEKLSSRKNQEKDQKFVEVIIRELFPDVEIQTKVRKAVGIINPETGAYLEIDFWIPSLKLGIEYQDKHHYGYQWYAHDTLENYQKRDDIKEDAMSALGYTLITIGYWWDKSLESLAATIRKFRPDLLQQYEASSALPIPTEPPLGHITTSPLIPGIVGVMSPFVPTNNFNPTNWYAGEKHDGIRGMYNHVMKKMYSRSGNELSILVPMLADIPNMLVEGEIVAGRGNYDKTAALSNHAHHDKVNWPTFRYIVFDIPDSKLGNYTDRYSLITGNLLARPFIFTQLAFRVLVANKDHLKMLVDSIINDAGEGVIAQQDSQYEYGRGSGIAKIKLRRDADAQVLRINKNSCTCKLVSGIIGDINFCNGFDPSKLKMGDTISYYHNGYLQSGKPKQGEIYKVRYDLTWDQLLGEEKAQSSSTRRSVEEAIGRSSLIEHISDRKTAGHWNKPVNVRAFLDGYARTAGFDPLLPENWYPVNVTALQNARGGGMLYAYSFNVQKALSCAYPELKFDNEKFISHQKPRGYWHRVCNVRDFFDEFARTAGFDPLIADNWYPVTVKSVQSGGAGLLSAYHNDLKTAIKIAYPELKFEPNKFRSPTMTKEKNKIGHWSKSTNVRAFFDEFARTSGFDPLVADNWYPVRSAAVQNAGGRGLLGAFDNNLQHALSCAYPELKFDKEKFVTHAILGHWNKAIDVRAFFDNFARASEFDPLEPKNWDTVKHSRLQIAGGSSLLRAYDHNLHKALAFAYPELQFDSNSSTT